MAPMDSLPPPRFVPDGESAGGSRAPGPAGAGGPGDSAHGAERRLRSLPLDVRELARFLLWRVDRGAEPGPEPERPEAPSFDTLVAAVGAVREAIIAAGEDGAPPERARVMHGRLDLEFVRLVSELLERHSRDAQALLRDVSHDLRSPLNSVLFLADALASEHSGSLNDVQRRQVSVLYTAAVALVALVNDLIDVSRLGDPAAIEVRAETFSIERVLEQVDRLVGPLARHSGVELGFRLETLGPRRGDQALLARILINLVSNAIQASAEGGRVEVRALEGPDGGLRLTVSDAGRDPDIERLRMQLRDAPLPRFGTGNHAGTHGLGLSICTRLVDAAGGAISVEAVPGSGCRFTADLPFGRA